MLRKSNDKLRLCRAGQQEPQATRVNEKRAIFPSVVFIEEWAFGKDDLEKVNFLLEAGYDLAFALDNYEKVRFYRGFRLCLVDGKMTLMKETTKETLLLKTAEQEGYVEVGTGVFYFEAE